MPQVTLRAGNDPTSINCGAGAAVSNAAGGSTVYYKDSYPMGVSDYEGTIAPGSSATLYGTVFAVASDRADCTVVELPPSSVVGSASSSMPWLVVDGSKVREGVNGPQFRATGFNSYVMKVAGGSTAQTMSATQRDRFFAGLRPKSLVRVWFFAPVLATYTEASVLAELDAIVASAKKYGHRIIGCLTSWTGSANDKFGAKNAAWFTTHAWRTSVTGANSYEVWLRTIAARYANEPTVCALDLFNEPQNQGGTFTSDLVLFAQENYATVKSLAPTTLVYIGAQGTSQLGGTTPYEQVFGALDFCATHDYSAIGLHRSTIPTVTSVRTLGKPLLIDEFSFWAKAYYGDPADVDVDVIGLPAVNYVGQGRMVESYLRSAFETVEVFGALSWSAMDSDGSWFTGAAAYEPPNDSPAVRTLRDMVIPEARGHLNDVIQGGSLEGWVDAAFTVRYKPGTRIGGPASGTTLNNKIFDRLGTEYRQATQANAPKASVWRSTTGRDWPTMEFTGTSRFPHSEMLVGSTAAHSFYAVFVPTALPSAATFGYLIAPFTNVNGFAVRIRDDGKVEVLRAGTVVSAGISASAVALNALYVLEARWDTASGAWSIRLNGNLEGSGTQTTTLADEIANIGADSAGANGFVGHLLEVFKTRTLTPSANQARLHSYLGRKYA